MKTIAAISSPIGAGGIGIVRVSGNDALGIADAIFNFGKETSRVRARGQNIIQHWEPLRMNFGTFVAEDFAIGDMRFTSLPLRLIRARTPWSSICTAACALCAARLTRS